MHRVIDTLTIQHDWRFIALAALVCGAGIATAFALMRMGRAAPARQFRLYGLSAATVAGLSVWASHVLAILGYDASVVRYDPWATLGSLGIAILGLTTCVLILAKRDGRSRRVLASVCAVSSIAAMHFLGASALHLHAARIVWDPGLVAGAIAASLILAIVSALPDRTASLWRLPLITMTVTASIVMLHFGCMAAMTLTPDPTLVAQGGMSETALFAVLVGGVSIIVATAALLTGVTSWTRTTALGQLREAIDAMPDGLAFYDADDRLLVWNSRYAEVNPELVAALHTGARFTDIIRTGLAEEYYLDAIGREEAWVDERLAARYGLSSSLEQQMVDGRWIRVQDRRTAAGGIVTVCNDITDLKRDALALTEARDAAQAANRAKSEFLANMSHEIRTPLNGVIGLAQALDSTELTPVQQEMLDLIQSSGRTLQVLLSDILDLARVESGRMAIASEAFDLARAVHDAAQLYAASAAEKGLQFFVDIDPSTEIWVRGDVVRLKQVLTNLISNAVKFTASGFVSLTVSRSARADGSERLRFTVEDTGVGFSAEARDRLFTRFEQADGSITRRFGGSGLGLAICRQLAGMMEGDLDCESEPGGGSTFILTLPLIPAECASAEPVLAGVAQSGARRVRVLLADDHPTNRRVVELILAQAPVDLTSVEDGAQALAACQVEVFDLILMDMQMPVMDGLTATREVRRHEASLGLARTPIVMLTANALPEHVAAGAAAGADRHLAKPFNAAELLTMVAELGGETQPKADVA